MKKSNNHLRKSLKVVSLIIIASAVLLLVMNITFESEPGAVPLAMLLAGIVSFGVIHYRVPSQEK